jgi:hypothetical protein
MLVIIIPILWVLIYSIYSKCKHEKIDDKIISAIILLTFIFTAIACIVIGSAFVAQPIWTEKITKIVSLERQTGVSGSFVLGSGTIKEQPVYYAYKEIKPDTCKLVSIPIDDRVYLKEGNNEPHVRSMFLHKKFTQWWHYLFINFNSSELKEVVITVPKTTILRGFKG